MRKPKPKSKAAHDAYSKGLGLLARREHSARELETKLSRGGTVDAEARKAVGKLKEKRYQSDERFADALARTRAGNGYGPRRIAAELKSHRVPATAIHAAIAALDSDWNAAAAAQVRRHFGSAAAADPAERARRARFLLRRGFDPATVRAVTRGDVDDSGEFD